VSVLGVAAASLLSLVLRAGPERTGLGDWQLAPLADAAVVDFLRGSTQPS